MGVTVSERYSSICESDQGPFIREFMLPTIFYLQHASQHLIKKIFLGQKGFQANSAVIIGIEITCGYLPAIYRYF